MTAPVPSKECFWTKCSDSRRCAAFGSCVAKTQAGGATFPQAMPASESPVTQQEIVSAIHHHARELARLTATWPAQDEIERLRTALTGIQSCSTCEACRGAATLALGGVQPKPAHEREMPHCSTCACPPYQAPEPEPTHFAFLIKRPRDKEAWPTIFTSCERAIAYEHRASAVVPVRLALPPSGEPQ